MNEFTLIRKNMFRKRLRAVLLTFSIAVAFFIFGLLGFRLNHSQNATSVARATADRKFLARLS